MKVERKHEIESNELASGLEAVGKYLQENLATLGLGLGIIIVAAVAYGLIFAEKPIDAPAGDWQKYMLALSNSSAAEELQLMIDSTADAKSPAVVQAKLSLGEMQLSDACKQLFEDRKAAKSSLEKSERNFLDVDRDAYDLLTRSRARLGLGAVYEAQDKPDEAKRYYEQVAKSAGAENPLAKQAALQLKRLESKQNREFLTWFVAHEPPAKLNPHGNLPFDPGLGLPETKDFSLPKMPADAGQPLIPGLPALDPGQKTSEKTPETKEQPAGDLPKTEGEKTEPATTEAAKPEITAAEAEKTAGDAVPTEKTPPAEK